MVQAYTRRGGELVASTTATTLLTASAVSYLPGGGFVVAWANQSNGAVRVQRYDAAGAKLGGEILISTSTSATHSLNEVSVTGLSNGGFVVGWQNNSEGGTFGDYGALGQLFDAAGAKIGGEFAFAPAAAGYQGSPDVTRLSGGGFVATWVEGDGAGHGTRGQIFNAQGVRVGNVFAVNTTLANNQLHPAVAGDAAGGFVAVWQDSTGGDFAGIAIRAQRFDAAGQKVGAETQVNHLSSNVVRADVTVLASGGYVVTWENRTNNAYDVKARVFDAAGQPLGAEFLVNTGTASEQGNAAVASLPWGGFVVTWHDFSQQNGDPSGAVRGQVFDAAGAKVGTEFLVNSVVAQDQIYPDVTVLDSGSIVFSWTDYSTASIKAQIFDPAGAPTDISLSRTTLSEAAVEGIAVAVISSDAAENASPIYTLVSDSTGGAFAIEGNRLVVADSAKLDFETAPGASVTIRVSDANGNSYQETIALTLTDSRDEVRYDAGAEFLVNSVQAGDQYAGSVAAFAGGFVFTWYSDGDIRAQLFAADGSRIGGEFAPATYQVNMQIGPSAASLASGGFAIAWGDSSQGGGDTSLYAVKMQMFDAAGARVGGELLVNETTDQFQYQPSIAALKGGGIVVAWTDESSSQGNIKARLYDDAGKALTGEFTVNTSLQFQQSAPSAAALAGGGFVISWYDQGAIGSDGGGGSVKAQIFDAAGKKVGGEFLVPTDTGGEQSDASVTGLAFGGFVVTWSDHTGFYYPQDSDVKGQMFDAAGNRVGGEFLVAANTAGDQFDAQVTALGWGGFAVSWADSGPEGDGSGSAVRVQICDSTGMRIGEPALLNVVTLRGQSSPAMAAIAGDALVVGWTDFGGDGGGTASPGVRARILALPDYPAVARADLLETDENLPLSGSVFADNGRGADSDPDGPPLAVAAVNGLAANVGQTIQLASGALLRVNADGTFRYDPNGVFDALAGRGSGASNVRGEDRFTYTLRDGTTAAATVTIHGVYSQGDTLIGTAGNDTITGSGFDETLRGLGGDDILIGGGGNDLLDGGAGDDIYYIDDAGDTIVDSSGYDEVRTTLASYSLLSKPIERLTGLLDTGQTLIGGGGVNFITG
ncbi:MAG TPA: Ig-like domain-containing protein, partial [Allosphingosinicella sp.]|nr:Ig-like domain-containing protein [Allosphingosinicella sp.]